VWPLEDIHSPQNLRLIVPPVLNFHGLLFASFSSGFFQNSFRPTNTYSIFTLISLLVFHWTPHRSSRYPTVLVVNPALRLAYATNGERLVLDIDVVTAYTTFPRAPSRWP
jgi:hypothetical protein